jgi:hypothetical protein
MKCRAFGSLLQWVRLIEWLGVNFTTASTLRVPESSKMDLVATGNCRNFFSAKLRHTHLGQLWQRKAGIGCQIVP